MVLTRKKWDRLEIGRLNNKATTIMVRELLKKGAGNGSSNMTLTQKKWDQPKVICLTYKVAASFRRYSKKSYGIEPYYGVSFLGPEGPFR